jgi:hypothetical protein
MDQRVESDDRSICPIIAIGNRSKCGECRVDGEGDKNDAGRPDVVRQSVGSPNQADDQRSPSEWGERRSLIVLRTRHMGKHLRYRHARSLQAWSDLGGVGHAVHRRSRRYDSRQRFSFDDQRWNRSVGVALFAGRARFTFGRADQHRWTARRGALRLRHQTTTVAGPRATDRGAVLRGAAPSVNRPSAHVVDTQTTRRPRAVDVRE